MMGRLLLGALLLLTHEAAQAFLFERTQVNEVFEFDGESHWQFGYELGQRFADKIQTRLRLNVAVQTLVLPYLETMEGQELYGTYLQSHNTTFPDFVEELDGIAQGSGVPFETIFALNLVEEFQDSIPTWFQANAAPAARRHTLRCSDIVLTSQDLRAVVHNEDSGAQDVNRTAIVIARIGNNPKFVAYTYLGDLPSGAFGFNQNGIAFTLNFVQPAQTEIGGLGRGFISRDLLNAQNSSDALQRITRTHQATGHNFQLMDVDSHRVWNVEAASFGRFAIHEYNVSTVKPSQVTAFFHANQYQRMVIDQPPYQSSIHRLKRYSELQPPTSIKEALKILGDQHDRSWPIFHDSLSHGRGDLSGWTLTTIVFDLNQRKAFSYRGNPSLGRVALVWDLQKLTVTKATNKEEAVA